VTRLVIWFLGWAFPLAATIRRLYRLITRPVTIGVRALVIDDGQVLLIRQHGSQHWVFPGGGVKRGETLRAAAVRETEEETGCRVVAERLLGIYSTVHEGMTNHVAVFVCRATSPPTDRLNIEIAEARYWPLDALPQPLAGLVTRRLAEYQAGAWGSDGRL
jgi:8-oxo-dGTP diphosphatase